LGYNKNKKEKRKNQNKDSVSIKFKNEWKQKRPILFFVGGFVILMVLFYAFWQSAFFNNSIHPKIVAVNAKLSGIILNLFGQHTETNREVISSASYSISISKGCDAIEAIALFLATTLAFPLSWRVKFRGLIIGVSVLFFLNIIRIVSLFFIGLYFPNIFEMMHVQIWPVIIIIFATVLWVLIIRSDIKNKKANAAKQAGFNFPA